MLRPLALLLGPLVVLSLWLLFQSAEVRDRFAAVEASVHSLARDRTVRFEGISFLDEVDLVPLLPSHETTAWWNLHLREVGTSIERHPLVRHAEVTTCAQTERACFVVEVQERLPSYIASGEGSEGQPGEAWVVASDGAFLIPAPAEDDGVEIAGRRFVSLPVVYGVLGAELHPQRVAARAEYVARGLRAIQKATGLELRRALLTQRGELEVLFENGPTTIVFEEPGEDQDERFQVQLSRFNALREKLSADLWRAERVDLAFDRLAVVRYPESGTDQKKVRAGRSVGKPSRHN